MMTFRKKICLQHALNKLLAAASPESQEYHALKHALADRGAFLAVAADVESAVAKKCGSDTEKTFLDQLKDFLADWGPTIVKICISLFLLSLAKRGLPDASPSKE